MSVRRVRWLGAAAAFVLAGCSSSTNDGPTDAGRDAEDAAVVDGAHAPPGPVVDGGGCNDEQGAAPQGCAALLADASVCGRYAFGACGGLRALLKNRVAAAAVSCVLGLPEADLCHGATARCGETALKVACDDPGADAPCKLIVDVCGGDGGGGAGADAGVPRSGTTMAQCKAFLSGMKASGRDKMQGCMTSTCGFYPCADAGTCGGGLVGCLAQLGGASPQ